MTIRVGPGEMCPECGDGYGHYPGCKRGARERERYEREQRMFHLNLGREVLEAIQNDDAERLGRLIADGGAK